MKNIVITGSSRGIGFGLADSFLQQGCAVTISGRSQKSVDAALKKLRAKHGSERLHGHPCEVTDYAQQEALWQAAIERWGQVDIWINNAGIGHPYLNMWELPLEAIDKVIDVDLKGLIYGARVAVKGMLAQGHGQLYNMEGFGSDGRIREGLSIYGATKRAVQYLTKALDKEAKETPVQICALSPGIVITDFITDQYKDDPERLEKAKPILNILGDHVETVTPWLAEKVLANTQSGTRIAWLTPTKITMRFLTARFKKRDLFSN